VKVSLDKNYNKIYNTYIQSSVDRKFRTKKRGHQPRKLNTNQDQ